MNRKRHSILLLLLFAVLLPSPVRAASVGDFVHVHALKTTLEGAVYRVTLPRFVYEGLMQPDQQDLAVFNAAGEVIPFVVREHEPSSRDIELSGGRVPFYELPPESGAADGVEPLDVYVETGAGGLP